MDEVGLFAGTLGSEKMEKDRPLMAVMLVVIASMLLIVSATNHTVGGAASGWDLSSDISSWSAKTSFHAGDFLGPFLHLCSIC